MQKHLCHFYLAFYIFYFIVSLSFVYVRQLGTGQYFMILGVLVSIVTAKHFRSQYKRLQHVQLVKTLVVVDSGTTSMSGQHTTMSQTREDTSGGSSRVRMSSV